MTTSDPFLSISAVMPAFNAAAMLPQSLGALVAMLRAGTIQEVILVDDGSTDSTADTARALGSQVLYSGGRQRGPGQARNEGVAGACGDVIWFVDADVVAHADGPRWIRHALQEPGAVATFGSYDDRPPAPGFVSQYKNLVHHHYHQIGRHEAATFWAGCGAVRRDAFVAIGGFDVARYPKPSIEDIELGYRLRGRGGRIVLCPELQGTHLKLWTLRNLIETDIKCRALPWARLLLSGAGPQNDLNVGVSEQIRAVIAAFLLGSLLAGMAGLLPWAVALGAFVTAMAANVDLLTRLARRNGWSFAVLAILLHQIYYLYSLAAYAWCWLEASVATRRPMVQRR
ncbi:MAG: glycosyltransferase family 2 protein [Pseudomonadota bacterium]|nr:glycosyltransferase family 2 protein [Pseudomonadota bacterium]